MTPIPKTKPIRDPKYIAWLRVLPCAVCGRGPCEAAHQRLLGGGGALKPGDDKALPYCWDCHHGIEHGLNGGILTLWNKKRPKPGGWTREDLREHLKGLCEKLRKRYQTRRK